MEQSAQKSHQEVHQTATDVAMSEKLQQKDVKASQIQQSKLSNLKKILFKTLIQKFTQEVQQKTFNSNQVIRSVDHYLLDLMKQQQKYLLSYLCRIQQIYEKQIKTELTLILLQLSKIPEIFIEVLQNQELTSYFVEINVLQESQLILQKLRIRIQERLSSNLKREHILSEYIQDEFYKNKFINELIKTIAIEIKSNFDHCKKNIMEKHLKEFEKLGQKSQILNVYLMYKVLRQISNSSKMLIQEHLIQGIFRHCSEQIVQTFAHYIMEKFEVIKFQVGFNSKQASKTKSRVDQQSVLILKNLEESKATKLTFRVAVNKDGQCALFIKSYLKQSEKDEEKSYADFLIRLHPNLESFYLVRCQTIRNTWFIQQKMRHIHSVSKKAYQIIKINQQIINQKYLNLQGKFDLQAMQKSNKMISINDLTNTGGTLGKCLVDINKYTDTSDFLKDISQRAILAHSFQTIFQKIPILGYLFIAGSLSYSFYSVVKNKMNSTDKKIKQFGNLALVASTSIGTSIAGGIIGQILIPIPVVGALLGTALGGFLGQRGSRKLTNFFQKKQFISMMSFLKKDQIQNRYWIVKKQTLRQLGLDQNNFYKQIPKKMQDFVFLTMICFVLVCFYESQRQKQYNKKKMQMKKQKPSSKVEMSYLIIDEVQISQKNMSQIKQSIQQQDRQKLKRFNSLKEKGRVTLTQEQKLQLEILAMKKDEEYKTSFDLKQMILFLEFKECSLVKNIQLLENVMVPFLAQLK